MSTAGGRAPIWNPNGRELVYIEGNETNVWSRRRFAVMSVQMADPTHPGRPQRLFENVTAVLPLDECSSTACYSISPDGQSFYTLHFRSREIPRIVSLRLVLNWFDDVRRLAPAN